MRQVKVGRKRDVVVDDEGVSKGGNSSAFFKKWNPVTITPIKGESLVAFWDVEIVNVGMHGLCDELCVVHRTGAGTIVANKYM